MSEYRKTILDELDLMREAGNAAQLKRNFAGSTLLYVPVVYWDYCRSNVMVMERIHGIIVSRMDELRARGTNIAKLAENGVEIFFTQVFRHNFFHADMHPGNIFVQTDDPQNPRYAAVDFGIVGTLQPRDQHYLAENFLAFFERDYAPRRGAAHRIGLGAPIGAGGRARIRGTHGVRADLQQAARRRSPSRRCCCACSRSRGASTCKFSRSSCCCKRRCSTSRVSGRQLYPELDLWKTAQPILQRWMRERMSPRTLLKQVRAQLPDTIEALKQLPQLFNTAVREAAEGRVRWQVQSAQIEELRRRAAQQSPCGATSRSRRRCCGFRVSSGWPRRRTCAGSAGCNSSPRRDCCCGSKPRSRDGGSQ